MREMLVIQKADPVALSVASLTRTSTTATVTTNSPHGFSTGDYVLPAGATPSGYNAKAKITVTGPSTFTFTCNSGLATPATGTITVTYVSDAQGGRRQTWRTVDTIHAELLQTRGGESIAPTQAVAAVVDFRFKVRATPTVTEKMRALWTPSWQASGTVRHELEIHAVSPFGDGRTYMVLDTGRAA